MWCLIFGHTFTYSEDSTGYRHRECANCSCKQHERDDMGYIWWETEE